MARVPHPTPESIHEILTFNSLALAIAFRKIFVQIKSPHEKVVFWNQVPSFQDTVHGQNPALICWISHTSNMCYWFSPSQVQDCVDQPYLSESHWVSMMYRPKYAVQRHHYLNKSMCIQICIVCVLVVSECIECIMCNVKKYVYDCMYVNLL